MTSLFSRITALAVVGGLLTCLSLHAQTTDCGVAGTDNAFLGIQTIPLWPGTPPQAKGNGCPDIPTITIFSPRQWMANGSAVVIFPGGGYAHLAADLEGREVADWFTSRGFKAFIVSYRLTSHGYVLPVPLLDARRAKRARKSSEHPPGSSKVDKGAACGGR